MTNFFTELKNFIEKNAYEYNLFFEYRGAKIPYEVAQEIYMEYFPLLEDYRAGNDFRDEQRDFIRLLREENAKLMNKLKPEVVMNHNCYRLGYEDAITEFAERLINNCDAPYWCVWMTDIEDLANEMKEKNDEMVD